MLSKRLLAILLATLLCVIPMASIAEQTEDASADTAAATEAETSLSIALNGRVVPDEPTHITVANATKVNGAFFSSQFGNNTSDIDVRTMLHGYNTVVWDTQLTFIVDPEVVEDYSKTTNSDGDTVYTITLAKDLTWNDGTPMDARDYVFGYYLQGSPEFEEITGDTDVWEHIVGYEDLRDGKTEYFSGIRLLGDYRFSITIKQEYLPFFYEYAYLSCAPSPIDVIAPGCEMADDGKGVYIKNIDETIEEPIYTTDLLRETILDTQTGYLSHPYKTCGPYSLVSYDADSGVVEFTLNEYYKGNYEGVKPVINNVTLITLLPQEMEAALENGEVDLINKVVDGDTINELRGLVSASQKTSAAPAEEEMEIETDDASASEEPTLEPTATPVPEENEAEHGIEVSNYARLGYGYIGLACEQGPQQFVKVRQAIAYAFDDDDFTRTFLKGYGITVQGFYGLGQWMYQAAIGTIRPETLTDEQAAIWDTFSIEQLNQYTVDTNRSLDLLIEDGWTLNENGEPYDPDKDTVRYKELEDGSLMRLSFTFGLCEDNNAAQEVLTRLRENMEPLGVEFVVETVPFEDLLRDHQRELGQERKYDMEFIAYNFTSVFDPLVELGADPNKLGSQNSTGLYDQELVDLAWAMHNTEPLDVTTYEQRWIDFQTRYNEILPTIPLYGNVYFDFYSDWLQNYNIESQASWPRALIYAFWNEPQEPVAEETSEEETADEEELEDGEIILDD